MQGSYYDKSASYKPLHNKVGLTILFSKFNDIYNSKFDELTGY